MAIDVREADRSFPQMSGLKYALKSIETPVLIAGSNGCIDIHYLPTVYQLYRRQLAAGGFNSRRI